MKIRAIQLDEDENPVQLTVDLTIVEAAFIARMVGKLNGVEADKIRHGGAEAVSSIYDALTGAFFNRFYEDGVDDREIPFR